MNLPDITTQDAVIDAVQRAIKEDLCGGDDVTSVSLVENDVTAKAILVAREACVVSGTGIASLAFREIDPSLVIDVLVSDGAEVGEGVTIMTIEGSARAILTAERTALNFMQRMTGIATQTYKFAALLSPHGVAVLDTRKTTPGLRAFEKYAVLCGGGENHRMGLYDRVLIKDNHRRLWRGGDAEQLGLAIGTARDKYPDVPVEVEVETEAELESALEGKPEWILLDNMGPEKLRDAVRIVDGRCKLEASGGIDMRNAEAIAATGIDAISLGCLTHSVQSIDLSLELE